jgi:hypothetical protein
MVDPGSTASIGAILAAWRLMYGTSIVLRGNKKQCQLRLFFSYQMDFSGTCTWPGAVLAG